jgi:hypothetical protein
MSLREKVRRGKKKEGENGGGQYHQREKVKREREKRGNYI